MERGQTEVKCGACGGAITLGQAVACDAGVTMHYLCSTEGLRAEAALARQQRDDARTLNERMKAATAKLLIAADRRIAQLRADLAALSGEAAGIQWKATVVTPDELADLETAGWQPQRIEFAEGDALMLKVALRRVVEPKAAALPDPAEDAPTNVLALHADDEAETPTTSPDDEPHQHMPAAYRSRVLALLASIADGRRSHDMKAARVALAAGLVAYGGRRRIDRLRLLPAGRKLLARPACEAA